MTRRRPLKNPGIRMCVLGALAAHVACGAGPRPPAPAALPAPAPAPGDPQPLGSQIAPEDVEKRPWIEYVRECADVLLAHGTDRYGPVHRPILVCILDVRTRECPADPLALDEAWRMTRRGRRGPAGANLYMDEPTLRAFLALTGLAGYPGYARFARDYVEHYTHNLLDDKGLFWWGWHRHYDVHRDVQDGHSGNYHEIHFQEALWPLLWETDPAAVRREIEAVWEWHVVDKATGEINRHADGKRDLDFAFTGGEILYAFAFLHAKTGERVWLDRARLVADYYWARRNPATGLVATCPATGAGRFDGLHFDTSLVGVLCPRLFRAFDLTGDAAFRDQAVGYLKAYARYGWDEGRRTYWASLKLDGSPVPAWAEPPGGPGYEKYQPRGPVDVWQPEAASYSCTLYAAQAYAEAYARTREPVFLEAARRWADVIRRAWPPRRCAPTGWYRPYTDRWAPLGTYAEYYGRAISFLLHLHALTGERDDLEFAKEVGREAVSKLWWNGLFRGHPGKPYYEASDGVGYLLVALLQLEEAGRGGVARVPPGNW